MYFIPGVVFVALLSVVGLGDQISRCLSFVRSNFGNLLVYSIGIGTSYSIGYSIHNFMSTIAKYLFGAAIAQSETLKENQTAEEAEDLIPSFRNIAEDLETRIKLSIGQKLLGNWLHEIKEELSADDRGVRYVRYLCEMMVMIKYPEIHHFTIERRSALKNFQISLSGILIIAGIIGIVNYIAGFAMKQGCGESSAIIGVAMVFVGIIMFLPIKKKEQDLRISIWRGFHAISLLEAKETKTVDAKLNSCQKDSDAS